jgi:hypothetical protein
MIKRLRISSVHRLTPVILRSAGSRYTTMATQPEPTTNRRESMQYPKSPSLAILESEDNATIRQRYRPFIIEDDAAEDWVTNLELTTAMDMAAQELHKSNNSRIKVLVLYGSLRQRSYSRLVALEASRILFRLGCDVRVFNPDGLPVKNDTDHSHAKVQELRELSQWSDGHVWISPEQHGNLVSTTYMHTFFIITIDDEPDRRIQKPNRLDPT